MVTRPHRWISLLVLLLIGLSSCGPTSSVARPNVRLIMAKSSDLWRYDVADDRWTQLTTLAPAAGVYEPALAPDGQRLAFTYRPPLPPASADQPLVIPPPTIAVQPLTGGAITVVLTPTVAGDTYDQPAWSTDGSLLYATHRAQHTDPSGAFFSVTTDIVAINPTTQAVATLIPNASFAAPSPDGTAIAAVRAFTDSLELHLIVYDLATKTEQILIQDPAITGLEAPTWSPNSQQIYLGVSRTMTGQRPPSLLDRVLGPTVAEAHGSNWRVCVLPRTGGPLRELSAQEFSDPRLVIDPSTILLWTITGLFLYNNEAQQFQPLLAPGDFGGITRHP